MQDAKSNNLPEAAGAPGGVRKTTRAAQGAPHRAIGVSAKRGRHLSEQAFDTYHVLPYGVPLGTLKTGFRLQASGFRLQATAIVLVLVLVLGFSSFSLSSLRSPRALRLPAGRQVEPLLFLPIRPFGA
jgi:hypothetical protein